LSKYQGGYSSSVSSSLEKNNFLIMVTESENIMVVKINRDFTMGSSHRAKKENNGKRKRKVTSEYCQVFLRRFSIRKETKR